MHKSKYTKKLGFLQNFVDSPILTILQKIVVSPELLEIFQKIGFFCLKNSKNGKSQKFWSFFREKNSNYLEKLQFVLPKNIIFKLHVSTLSDLHSTMKIVSKSTLWPHLPPAWAMLVFKIYLTLFLAANFSRYYKNINVKIKTF